ncbi:MAG: hypothetical protein KDK45_04290 [Leptospiraceae bacterium]|nr:hypothetical protein [Leptospiraceae bacterium]
MPKYTDDLKELAYKVYRELGQLEATYRKLRKDPRFKGISKSTVIRWSETPNVQNLTWKGRYELVKTAREENSDKDYAREQDKMVEEIRKQMLYLHEKTFEAGVKSAEGAAKAYATLAKEYTRLTGIDITREQFVLMYQTILETLSAHPVVGPVVAQFWQELEMKLDLEYERTFKK